MICASHSTQFWISFQITDLFFISRSLSNLNTSSPFAILCFHSLKNCQKYFSFFKSQIYSDLASSLKTFHLHEVLLISFLVRELTILLSCFEECCHPSNCSDWYWDIYFFLYHIFNSTTINNPYSILFHTFPSALQTIRTISQVLALVL